MDRTRQYGGLICIATVVAGLLFIIGVFKGGCAGYVALAIPVTAITLFLLGLVFWIGWTIYSIKIEPVESEDQD